MINTALVGERYTLGAFRQYKEKVSDVEANVVFAEVMTAKESHIQRLETRLRQFDEQVSWQAVGSEASQLSRVGYSPAMSKKFCAGLSVICKPAW